MRSLIVDRDHRPASRNRQHGLGSPFGGTAMVHVMGDSLEPLDDETAGHGIGQPLNDMLGSGAGRVVDGEILGKRHFRID